MTEINTNAQANRVPGLASGMNTNQTIQNLLRIERRRLEPVENRKEQAQIELDSFDQVKTVLEDLEGILGTLASNNLWEGKIVETSNEEVVTATATAGAAPGNHTLIVERMALNHQISSQGYETNDQIVGMGRFIITVGEENPITVVIDETNNTLEGLKDAINAASEDVQSTIIRTGNQLKPFQLVLTSQKTGSEGRIALEIDLQGGETPNFSNLVEEPSDWAGIGAPTERPTVATGTGASNAIMRVVGDYTGDDDKLFTFTAVQTGTVGGESQLQVRWETDTGENGVLELDSFNYAPGEATPFADGLSLVLSEGDIIVGDSFTVRTRSQRSDLFWWLPQEERDAGFSQPSRWERQATFGGPQIEGDYSGEDDAEFTLTVEGSGPIGAASNLRIRWERDDGKSGIVNVGRGYQPGSQLALIDGLRLKLDAGVLNPSDSATFRVTAEELSGRWWLDESERRISAEILDVTAWIPSEEEVEEEFGVQPEFPEEFGPRKSTADKSVTGEFISDEAKVYTFTALRDGTIGTTRDLNIRWEDDKGNSGQVRAGEDYVVGAPLEFDSGISISFGAGQVFESDTFTVRANTSTIQPPQDALIRFGATEFGGGLEITNPTNEFDEVIEGVKLRLVSTSEDPVTITIKGDTEAAVENTLAFAEKYNEFLTLVSELTKFDLDNQVAGPLLSNRDIDNIRRNLTSLLINPVAGLPRSSNMVFAIGLKLTEKGMLEIDENTVRSKIEADFGAVADLFRAKGVSGTSGVDVVGLTNDTQINPEGFPVEITGLASAGSYTTPPLIEPILINEVNGNFFLSVDGRQSEQISLPAGAYTIQEYASALQNEITNDPVIGNRRVRVSVEGNKLRVASGRMGTSSEIVFGPIGAGRPAGVGLLEGQAVAGTDVIGTIDGEPGDGLGQVLRAPENSKKAKGLRLFVTLGPNQISDAGPEALIKVTKGVAARMAAFLDGITDPLQGDMKRITDGLRSRIRTFDSQLDGINERIERKRGELTQKFTRLETQMATMRAQQSMIQGQLGSSGGGLPGLPRG